MFVEECKDKGIFKGFFIVGGLSVLVLEKVFVKVKEFFLEIDIVVDGFIM